MSVEQLVNRLKQAGTKLSVIQGKVKISLPKSIDAALKAELIEHKEAVKDYLEQLFALKSTVPEVLAHSFDNGDIPLSFAQQRLWFLDRLNEDSSEYNMQAALEVVGDFDIGIAEKCLQEIIKRHQVLRTVYLGEGKEPKQYIHDEVVFKLDCRDLTGLSGEEQQKKLKQLIRSDSRQAFDLSRDVMVRASYIKLVSANNTNKAQAKAVLVFNMHHIASDGWSQQILTREFIALYQAFAANQASPLPPLPVQYADYGHWQRQWLQGEVLENQLNYWQQQLADLPPVHSLVLDHPRPVVKSHLGAQVRGTLPAEVSNGLNALAKSHQMTPFMLLHAALALVLSRHSNSQDIVLGTPVANRRQAELESLIGFFVNTLVLRLDTRETDLSQYLAAVRQVHLDAQSHQDVPFEQLVERLKVPRSSAHAPLFQIMLTMNTDYALEETGAEPGIRLPGLTLTPLEAEDEVAVKFDLNIALSFSEQGLAVDWTYDTSIFSAEHIQQLSSHFLHLLTDLSRAQAKGITSTSALTMLGEDESRYLVEEVNNTAQVFADDMLLHELFQQQALATPDKPALLSSGLELSYSQVNERANQLAHRLTALGVETDSLVGICLPRSADMVICILAVLKAGGAYLPLDPEYPQQRLSYMAKDSDLKVLLTQQALLEIFAEQALTSIVLDDAAHQQAIAALPVANPGRVAGQTKQSLAYVIYTSGSTGRPKGVMISHGAAVNLAYSLKTLNLGSKGERQGAWGWVASFAFDASVQGLSQLCLGQPLAVITEEQKLSLSLLKEQIKRHNIQVLDCSPALLELWGSQVSGQLSDTGLAVDLLIGGEAISAPLWQNLVAYQTQRATSCYNVYGPTECTVDSCWARITGEEPVIGLMLPNTYGLVLTPDLQLTPQGSIGELYIGGAGLARGYLNRAELTKQSFIADPYHRDSSARLYKTGDLVRYLANGELVFIGRRDEQVKIRGYRIELGEIEQQIARCPGVNGQLVQLQGDEQGNKRLVAYLILAADTQAAGDSLAQIKAQLLQVLPDYMVPSAFVVLEDWPLTANGKIDKKALPAPDGALSAAEYVAPETETEQLLVQIWADLLQLDASSISIKGNFFELGGHSLLSIRLIGEIREKLGIELSVKAVFDAPTIAELARLSEPKTPLRTSVTPVARDSELMPLSFAQQRLWLVDQLGDGSPEYNMPLALELSGDFDQASAELALKQIIERHEVLRTTYVQYEQQAGQKIHAKAGFNLVCHDLTHLSENEQQRQLQQLVSADMRRPFDLNRDLMVRAGIIKLTAKDTAADKPAKAVLMFNMHHIASDGWSMQVLVREFVSLYRALAGGEQLCLPPLAIQYADYAHWQRHWLQGEVLESQLDYWQRQLAELPPVHALPLDSPRPEVKQTRGARVHGQLPAETTAALSDLARARQMTPFMLLHAALALVLSRHSNSQDIVIGTPVANRMQPELEPLIGFFVNTLVLRVDTRETDLDKYLSAVRQVHLDAQSHQDVPFEQLVELLKAPRSTAHTPLFQIMLTINSDYGLSGAESGFSLPGLAITPYKNQVPGDVAVKFDLNIELTLNESGLSVDWTYDSSIFTGVHIEQLNTNFLHLLTVLSQVAEQGIISTKALTMLGKDETAALLSALDNSGDELAQPALLHDLFAHQAALIPDKTALACNEQQLSYSQLNERANQLARHLRALGVATDTLVGICLPRSCDMVISILAVLKAGGAYVPLDPEHPQQRLAYMANDSELTVLLTEKDWLTVFADQELKAVVLDDEMQQQEIAAYSRQNLEPLAAQTTESLAYVIYTSGSTGRPKGVMISHGGAVNLAYSLETLGLGKSSEAHEKSGAWGWIASFAFDASVQGLGQLCLGQTLVVITEEQKLDLALLKEQLNRHQVGVIDCSPALVELWGTQAKGLLTESGLAVDLLIGGEAISASLWQSLVAYQQQTGKSAFNVYGPTECSVDSCWARISGEQPVIGQMLPNTRGVVMTRDLQLAPQGSIGELYIGGAGLARGYLNRPELTQQSFIADPFSGDIGERLYKTGDLVRYLANGQLAFIGRQDEQVKIRGYRIELEEIEQQLALCQGVKSHLVRLVADPSGNKRLVAYVILAPEPQTQEEQLAQIKASLQQALPDYMVPSAFVVLDDWPLTANGKIDRKALPTPQASAFAGAYVAPETETEQLLVPIWANLLNLEPTAISTRADFFDLGGHSLLVVRLKSVLQSELDIDYPVKELFSNSTISEQAALIDLYRLSAGPETVEGDYLVEEF